MDWQPIETAPRDGTPILIYGIIWGCSDDIKCAVAWYRYGGWEYSGHCGCLAENPQFWIPLPEPPKGPGSFAGEFGQGGRTHYINSLSEAKRAEVMLGDRGARLIRTHNLTDYGIINGWICSECKQQARRSIDIKHIDGCSFITTSPDTPE